MTVRVQRLTEPARGQRARGRGFAIQRRPARFQGVDHGEPVVVVALLDAPVFDPEHFSGLPYFRESLDLLLGVVHGGDREFLVYHADRRRFQLAERDEPEV